MSNNPPDDPHRPFRPGGEDEPGTSESWTQPAGGGFRSSDDEPRGGFQPAESTQPFTSGEPDDVDTSGPGGGKRSRKGLIAGIVAAVVVLGGALAGFLVFRSVAGTEDVLDDQVPAGSVAYVTAYLDPGASQKVAIKNLAKKFPALSGQDLGSTVERGLNQAFSESGLSFSRDVKPWLGTQVAVAVVPTGDSFAGVFLANAKDTAKARQALQKAETAPNFGGSLEWTSETYKGVEIRKGSFSFGGDTTDRVAAAYAISGDTVMLGQEDTIVDGIKAVVDTEQGKDALADDEAFQATVDALPKTTLGIAFVNPTEAFGALLTGRGGGSFATPTPFPSGITSTIGQSAPRPQIGPNPFQGIQMFKGFGAALTAKDEGLGLDVALVFDPDKLTPEQKALLEGGDEDNDTVGAMPKDAFGVIGFTGVDKLVDSFLEQAGAVPDVRRTIEELDLRGVLDNLTGDIGVEVGPGNGPESSLPVNGAIIVGTDDDDGMEAFLDKASRKVLGPSADFATQQHDGVTIHVASAEGEDVHPAYAVSDGLAIIAPSPDEVIAVLDARDGENIEDDDTFSDATSQVPGGNALFYADVEAILNEFRQPLQESGGGIFAAIEPNLRPVKAFIVTSEQSGDAALLHLFVLIR